MNNIGLFQLSRCVHPRYTPWIIPWIMLLFTSCVAITDQCPEGCICTAQLNGSYVRCEYMDPAWIPDNIPLDTIVLDLRYNAISDISTLPILKNVKEIRLDFNTIQTLLDNSFERFPNLEKLTLSSNKIEHIKDHAFSGSPNLRHLDLQNNIITQLRLEVFKNLNLDLLNLNNNRIQSVTRSNVDNIHIGELRLDYNEISSLRDNVFSHLKESLSKLYLSYNRVPLSIDTDTFQDFAFTQMSLTFDGLSDVSFLENLATRKLDLSGNLFDVSSLQNYRSLENIEELYLVNCSLNGLDKEHFFYLRNIKLLDLSQNNLRLLSKDVFNHTHKLKTLKLNENKLTDFTTSIPSVDILMLSSNQITKLTTSFFSNIKSRLLELDLSYNLIQVLDESLLPLIDSIPTLSFHGNPFHCNCELRWFRDWLANRESYTGAYNCRSPSPGYILDRDPEDFTCKEPVIKFISPDVVVNVGDEVFLSCTGEGDPAPIVEFETPLEGHEYRVSPPRNRTNTRTFAAYKLTYVNLNEGGVYVCKATNIAGSTFQSMQVTVLSDRTVPSSPPVVVVTMQHSMTSVQDTDAELSTVSDIPMMIDTKDKSKNKMSNLTKIIIIVCVSLIVPMLMLVTYLVVRYAKNHRNRERYTVYRKQRPNSDRVDYYKMNGRPPDEGKTNGVAMV